MALRPPFVAALSPLVAGLVMAAQALVFSDPALVLVASGVVAVGFLPMLVAAFVCEHHIGVRRVRSMIGLTVIGVADLVHFNVRVGSWVAEELAPGHWTTVTPSLVVLAALVWMWRTSNVGSALSTPPR